MMKLMERTVERTCKQRATSLSPRGGRPDQESRPDAVKEALETGERAISKTVSRDSTATHSVPRQQGCE